MPSQTFVDCAGALDRWELYAVLITDAKSKDCARLLLRAAVEDPAVTPGELGRISDRFILNHGAGR